MSTIYFIGGAPRSGKTTLIQKLIKEKPMVAASTDAIRSVAKGMIDSSVNPALFQEARGSFGSDKHVQLLKSDPKAALQSEIASAEETFKSVLNFLSYYQRDGIDAAIEGVAVLPYLLENVDFDFKAVFFVNLSDQTEVILNNARHNENDWTSKYDDEIIRLYCKFNQVWNQYYADEAKKRDLPLVVVNDDYESSLQEAVDILLK